ncbi:MAG: DUF6020 family protein [Eubacteriales bacterium]|nr:DUF6020 family protein [Eubacteriales bacterium]
MKLRLSSIGRQRVFAAVCALLSTYALAFLLGASVGDGFVPLLLAFPLYVFYRRAFRPGCQRACAWAAFFCAALYTLFHITGDYHRLATTLPAEVPGLLPVWLGLLAFYAGVTFLLMRAAFDYTSLRKTAGIPSRKARRIAFLLPFAVILLCWSLYLLAFFPGSVVPDSKEQLRQALGEMPYNQLFSAAHTFLISLIVRPVMSLTNQNIALAVAAYCAVQMALTAMVCAYAVYVLYACGVKRWIAVAAALFFALMPYHGFFSVTILKDVPFSAAVLLLTAACFRLWWRYRTTGAATLKPYRVELILMFLSGVLICLLRVNGLAMFAPFCIIAALFLWKKRRVLVMPLVSALVLATVIQYAVYPLVGVEAPTDVDRFFVPFQQIARVVVDDQPLTDGERAQLDRYMDVNQIKNVYEGVLSDPIRELVRATCGTEYLAAHKSEWMQLWLTLGRKYPLSYLRAQIDLNSGYYFPRLFYVYAERIAVDYNGLRNYPKLPSQAVALLRAWGRLFSQNGVWSLPWMIAGPVWAMWFLTLLSAARHRWAALVLLSPVLLLWGFLLLGTPLSGEFRYLYALFLGLPVYFAAAFAQSPPSSGPTVAEADTGIPSTAAS